MPTGAVSTNGLSTKGIARLLLLTLLAAEPAVAVSRTDEEPPAELDILAVSPEMASFIEQRVRPGQVRTAKAKALLGALFGEDGLNITYGDDQTKTAIETFESGSGNCLSFTLLFVALARHVGLEARFREVGEILSWDRRGDVAVNRRHMFAEIDTMDGRKQVDFLPGVEKLYRLVRGIDEQRVRAHYFSNLGAEPLTADDLERAMRMFKRAVQEDETLAAAWVNMGVTHRRLGEGEAAEASYLRALEIDPNELSAASNLAGLYHATGRERLAASYLRRVKRHRRSNPFWYFRLGLEAAARGELEEASRKLKRAIRLLPKDAMFRAELGKIQERRGNLRRAERSYKKALQLATDDQQRLIIGELLRQVRDAAGSWGQNDIKGFASTGDADNTLLENASIKTNIQNTASNSALASYDNGDKIRNGRGAGPTRSPESLWDQRGPSARSSPS